MKDRDNSIIAIEKGEFEPASIARVTRTRVSGGNRFGRPIANDLETRDFTSLEQAISWCLEASEYSLYFAIPIKNLGLSGKLYGPRVPQQETLVLERDNKTSESSRMIDDHHSVSADPATREIMSLNIHLDHSQTPLFDRGVAWVSLDDPNVLTFSVNAGVHTPEEISEGLFQLTSRVNLIINNLLYGQHAA